MLVLIAGLLMMVLVMVAFSVDIALMHLARTELRVATDAAAKAATYMLTETNGDTNAAIAEGIAIAGQNEVAGSPLTLTSTDFEFGQATRNLDGTWSFQSGVFPYASVRVTGEKSATSASGPVNLFFGGVFGRDTFTPTEIATASQFQQELVLCVDRSHSLCFDESGTAWVYPPGTPTSPSEAAYPPHDPGSRWVALEEGVELFIDTLQTVSTPPDVALVTWASDITSADYGLPTSPVRQFYAATLDQGLSSDLTVIEPRIQALGNDMMLGATNMSAGIDLSRSVLNASTNTLAHQVIVLMTDGQWNQGRDPVSAAQDAFAEGIVIHTVTFLSNADQTTMQQIANATGGQHYHAENRGQLRQVFQELALMLPVMLTE